ncbi:MAG: hypothetical protein GFH27_549321n48 [Chloroflexi bacterium AL-W]|nr:hypothetical protein [Chloroflexi bacterium AL-N1]NOK64926.1 hypothetical protein [Chloroflexi bacterium AL-N10]NOK76696.1 hypothetical protein [Chloroflexi bacterium AL-N5]NOK84587.1 hypothetical protein [Chloroflexi bacterium AL-W]NOK86588.1 hypothetical protein [Chloroflexi bacterium AL-N15]
MTEVVTLVPLSTQIKVTPVATVIADRDPFGDLSHPGIQRTVQSDGKINLTTTPVRRQCPQNHACRTTSRTTPTSAPGSSIEGSIGRNYFCENYVVGRQLNPVGETQGIDDYFSW